MAAAAVMGAGALYTGIQAQKAAKEQADAANQNAANAMSQAKSDAAMQAIQGQKQIAGEKADFAAGGVSGGSVMATIADSMANAELDRLNIIHGGQMRSRAYSAEATAAKRAGNNALVGSLFKAAGYGASALGPSKEVDKTPSTKTSGVGGSKFGAQAYPGAD